MIILEKSEKRKKIKNKTASTAIEVSISMLSE